MNNRVIVIFLGVYIFVMGVLGLARTNSFTPLYISGAISAVTIWLGWLLGKGMRSVRNVVLTWLSLTTAVMAYITFGRIQAHANQDSGSMLIFGSMGLFALIALVLVWRTDPRRGQRNSRRHY